MDGIMKNNIVAIFIIFLLIIFGNISNIFGNNWFLHPDETGSYFVAQNIYKTGKIIYTNKYNSLYKTTAFTPADLYFNGKYDLPRKPIAYYLLISPSFILGENGPFYLSFLISVFSVISIYYLSLKFTDNHNIATIASIVWSSSASFLYWSNFLYGNLLSISLLFIGIGFLLNKNELNNKFIYGSILLAMSVLIRYEFILFTLPAIIMFSIFKIKNSKRITIFFLAIFSSIILLIPISNYKIFGSIIPTSYMNDLSEYDKSNLNTKQNLYQNSLNKIIYGFKSVYTRFLSNDFKPNWNRIYNNFHTNIAEGNVLIYVLGSIGIILFILNNKNSNQKKLIATALTIAVLYWSYNTLGGYHWGEGSEGIGLVYTRYLLVTVALYSIFTAIFINFLIKKSNGRFISKIVILLLLVLHVFQSVQILFYKNNNLIQSISQKNDLLKINNIVNQLPTDSVIVTNLLSKGINNITVLDYQKIQEIDEIKIKNTTNYIENLLINKTDVYLLEAFTHKASYLNIEENLSKNNDIISTGTDTEIKTKNFGDLKLTKLVFNK